MKMSGLLLFIVGILIKVCNGRKLTMTLESEASYEGNPTTLSCSYTILDNTYGLHDLEWFKGDSFTGPSTLKIADFYRAAASPSYYNVYDDPTKYLVSRDNDNSISTFDIFNVDFSNDRGRYWCRVTVRPIGGGATVNEIASTDLIVYITNGQVVTMSLESETSYVGDHTAISCSYAISDSSYLVYTLSWFKGDSPLDPSTKKIADFIREETSPYYANGYDDQSRYNVSRSGNSGSFVSTFDIFNVEFSRDRGRYLCRVTVIRLDGTNPFDTADSTDLIVYSPPDIPVISGSLTMTADMVTTLTCTADLGYPDDWDLVWSNSGSDIRDQPNTMAALSGTSQRYMFTSELEFTPKRRDNTHFINCTASRASWTSTPLPEYKWGPINVQYEGSITNKHLTEVGIGGGLTANLTCIAKGNPAPIITWVDPNGVDIITGGNSNKHTVVVSYTTSDTDMTIGNVTTSTLSIWAVDPQVDYGVYTCNSNNGIGQPDKHEIIVNGTRVPDQPTGVVLTDRTSSSIAVRWSAGYDGGETQWFHVSHKKTAEDSSETFSDRIDGEVTTYNVDGLESFTEYEIKVYAQNDVGRNPRPGSIVEYTLPGVPTSDSGFTLLFDSNEGTVKIDGLNANKGECIQLEVKREGIPGWTSCGDCIETNGTFTLLYWCLQTRKRRGRAIGDVEMVRAKLCQMISKLCGDFINVMEPVTDPPASSTTGTAVGVTVGIVSLAVIVFALVFYFRRKYRNRNGSAEEINLTTQTRKHQGLEQKRNALQGTADYQEVADIVEPTDRTYANVLFKDKSFPRDMLKIIKELGHGAFGEVFLAEAKGILKKSKVTLVAVKTLKEGASQSDKDDLLRELDLMKKLPDHKNVVRLMGFSVEQDPLYIIVEYLSKGNLKDLLKDSRVKGTTVYGNLHGASKSLSCGDLMKFANDVADGMHYISSQKCIHRDLAARNVLVAEDMTCKVSDFGLARDVIDNRVYERKSEGRLPLRWMALESILDEMYTTKSDVWSFGVLLWEIVTLGARPYPTMSAKLMLKQLRIGFRMPQPTHCQGELYEMMLKCWEEEPDRRPTFEVIADELRQLRELDKDYIVVNAYEETIYAVTIPDGEQEKC
ncbi:uncharacterized protein [Asterias amurensis]|uniref:uncharacterized protein isoform X4 n=1 Tax=Asterias amurensis TaxID=7602 RepID=UPI003AB3C079